ncbi:unnamed protein product [Eruca vesicaria subsp. sativa]|uniref:Uncharacterized protein n=1 Tax=Eruca vesicaria subsp. sativa TaxID=29727 RepID=A0ABC8LCL4_ERUVS|nr:unnamed protein product [Eruca vesicaria subsp. sativa]
MLHGEHSCIEEIIYKFAQLTPQERTKRYGKHYYALKKTLKKLDHDVSIQEFLGASNQVAISQAQVMECHRRISFWMNIDRIENTEHLSLLEESLRKSIERIQFHTEHYGKKQLLPIEYTTTQVKTICSAYPLSLSVFSGQLLNQTKALKLQFHSGSSMQEADAMSWLPDNSNQQTILTGDSSFLPHREMDGSVPDYSNCFDETIKQEDQKCRNLGKQFEQLEQQGDGCLGLQQVGEQYSYPTPFATTLVMEEGPSSMYDPTASSSGCFQIPQDQNMFATDHHHHHQNWVSGSMFGQTSYNQVCVSHLTLELS